MKSSYYYAPPIIMLIGLWIASCGNALYKGHILLFIIEQLIFLVVLVKYKYIYYPYISTLCISNSAIERRILGIVHTSLDRSTIHISYLTINKTKFVVFSAHKLEHYWEGSVAEMARKHEAIMYPITNKLLSDFPEFFQ